MYKLKRYQLDNIDQVEADMNALHAEGFTIYQVDIVTTPGGAGYIVLYEKPGLPSRSADLPDANTTVKAILEGAPAPNFFGAK